MFRSRGPVVVVVMLRLDRLISLQSKYSSKATLHLIAHLD